MNDSTLADLENLFLALSDRTRLRLLALMANGEVSVGFLADTLGESQPKISRHLAYLRTAGIVITRRDGKHVYYCIDVKGDEAAKVLDATLRSIVPNVRVFPGNAVEDISNVARADEVNIYAETYIDDWSPNEMEIHLL